MTDHSSLEFIFDEYILIGPGSDYGLVMWSDIDKLPCGRVLYSPIRDSNRVLSTLYRLHFSFEINKKINLPFQGIWRNRYSLSQVEFDGDKKYCVIYTDISAARTDVGYLKQLKQTSNVYLVLALVNTMRHRKEVLRSRIPLFDKVFSFDETDCEKYGFVHHPMNYSIITFKKQKGLSSDAFFVGKAVDREKEIVSLYKKMIQHQLDVQFFVAKSSSREHEPGIHYNEWLQYSDVLNYILNTNCIVEIMNGEQNGATLRTMEAICYNKKLLTNNKAMRNSPYYNEKYIQIFEKIDEIDIDFIRARENVDYGYKGDFSPINFIKHIDGCFIQEEGIK